MDPIPESKPFTPSPTPSVSTMPTAPKPKRTRQTILIAVLLLLVAIGAFGYFTGFSFDISRFFASATCPNEGQKFCSGGDLYELDANPSGYGCVQTKIEDCGTGTCVQTSSTDAHCQAAEPPPAEPPPAEPPPPPPVTNACSGKFILDDHDGVTVCYVGSSISRDDLCTIGGRGSQHTWTVRIVNNQASGYVYSNVSLFYQTTQTCSANATIPSGTAGIRSGDGKVYAGETEDVTYTFTFGEDCGAYQLDDTWGPGGMRDGWFAIGKVFNTGITCTTPTPTPTLTPTPTPTPTLTPTPTPTQTPTPTPTPTDSTPPTTSTAPPAIACTPSAQNAAVGQTVTITGTGATASTPYYWYAPGGTPDYLPGNPFSVFYETPGTKTVTVAWGGNQATCIVVVSTSPTTPTPTPTDSVPPTTSTPPDDFVCTPASTMLYVNASGTWNASGGTAPVMWSAPDANTASGSGSTFTTSYGARGTYQITATDASQRTAVCTVNVRRRGGGGGSSGAPDLDIVKAVRSYPNGLEQENVTVAPGSTVEFVITVFNDGNRAATEVIVRDSLPAGLTYIPGSTTIDNTTPAADGITAGGLNIGDLAPDDSIAIRFRATVAPSTFFSLGTTVLTDLATAKGSNTSEVSDTAQVTVIKGAVVSPPSVTSVPTGPGESTLLALIVSVIITLLYVGYTSTGTFQRRDVRALAREEKNSLDFRR
jgi:uncharacterized repeat protein (TIGR01451 family)